MPKHDVVIAGGGPTGFLFRDGYSLQFVAIAMSVGSLIGSLRRGSLRRRR